MNKQQQKILLRAVALVLAFFVFLAWFTSGGVTI